MTEQELKIRDAICDLIDKHPDKVQQVQYNESLLGWFVGQVMKRMNGEADPAYVRERLKAHMMLTLPQES